MIFVLRLYELDTVDVPAFTAAFDEDGPWRRLSGRLHGYIHTDLLLRSTFPTVFLLLEFWLSEQHFAIAESDAEVRGFLRSLRNLAASHQNLGVFCFRSQWEKETVQGSSFRMPPIFPDGGCGSERRAPAGIASGAPSRLRCARPVLNG